MRSAGLIEESSKAAMEAGKGYVRTPFFSDLCRQMRVDVFIEEPFDFDTEYTAAFEAELAPGVVVRILRLESLIRMKKAAGRSKDIEDVQICAGARRCAAMTPEEELIGAFALEKAHVAHGIFSQKGAKEAKNFAMQRPAINHQLSTGSVPLGLGLFIPPEEA